MPLVPFPQIVGPSYQSASLDADCERTMNLFPETIESGQGKNRQYLRKCAGLRVFATPNAGPVQGMYTSQGRSFVVSGAQLFELKQGGTTTLLGATGSGAVSMVSNGYQLLVADAQGNGYCYDLTSGVLSTVAGGGWAGGAPYVGVLDTYGIALHPGTNQFGFSAQSDFTSWDGLDYIAVDGSGDWPIAMIVDHGYVWLFGQFHCEIYYDAGDPLTVFDRVPQGYIEVGISAPLSLCQLNNALAWLGGGDPEGTPICWWMNGFSPARISTHGIETIWATYPKVSDARAFTYSEGGHEFYCITFPSANLDWSGVAHGATWAYDAVTSQWHERGYWNLQYGMYEQHRGICHTSNWGVNLVGDYVNGNIYVLDPLTYSDNGNPLRWLRRCPHISENQQWLFFSEFQVDAQVGVGLNGTVQGANPQMVMRYSNDGGNTWTSEKTASMGAIGTFLTRVIWRRLGRGRDRVWELSGTDPVAVAIINAYMNVTLGTN